MIIDLNPTPLEQSTQTKIIIKEQVCITIDNKGNKIPFYKEHFEGYFKNEDLKKGVTIRYLTTN